MEHEEPLCRLGVGSVVSVGDGGGGGERGARDAVAGGSAAVRSRPRERGAQPEPGYEMATGIGSPIMASIITGSQ
jgi:hypothetical protein